jgi:hypothetical protein
MTAPSSPIGYRPTVLTRETVTIDPNRIKKAGNAEAAELIGRIPFFDSEKALASTYDSQEINALVEQAQNIFHTPDFAKSEESGSAHHSLIQQHENINNAIKSLDLEIKVKTKDITDETDVDTKKNLNSEKKALEDQRTLLTGKRTKLQSTLDQLKEFEKQSKLIESHQAELEKAKGNPAEYSQARINSLINEIGNAIEARATALSKIEEKFIESRNYYSNLSIERKNINNQIESLESLISSWEGLDEEEQKIFLTTHTNAKDNKKALDEIRTILQGHGLDQNVTNIEQAKALLEKIQQRSETLDKSNSVADFDNLVESIKAGHSSEEEHKGQIEDFYIHLNGVDIDYTTNRIAQLIKAEKAHNQTLEEFHEGAQDPAVKVFIAEQTKLLNEAIKEINKIAPFIERYEKLSTLKTKRDAASGDEKTKLAKQVDAEINSLYNSFNLLDLDGKPLKGSDARSSVSEKESFLTDMFGSESATVMTQYKEQETAAQTELISADPAIFSKYFEDFQAASTTHDKATRELDKQTKNLTDFETKNKHFIDNKDNWLERKVVDEKPVFTSDSLPIKLEAALDAYNKAASADKDSQKAALDALFTPEIQDLMEANSVAYDTNQPATNVSKLKALLEKLEKAHKKLGDDKTTATEAESKALETKDALEILLKVNDDVFNAYEGILQSQREQGLYKVLGSIAEAAKYAQTPEDKQLLLDKLAEVQKSLGDQAASHTTEIDALKEQIGAKSSDPNAPTGSGNDSNKSLQEQIDALKNNGNGSGMGLLGWLATLGSGSVGAIVAFIMGKQSADDQKKKFKATMAQLDQSMGELQQMTIRTAQSVNRINNGLQKATQEANKANTEIQRTRKRVNNIVKFQRRRKKQDARV